MADNTSSHLPDGDASSIPLQDDEHTTPSRVLEGQRSASDERPQRNVITQSEPRLSTFPDQKPSDPSSSIKVTHRTERSFFMHVLQVLIKPVNAHVIKPRKIFPPGSPQLTIPKRALKTCHVRERKVDGMYIYDITAKQGATSRATHEARKMQNGCVLGPTEQHALQKELELDADSDGFDAGTQQQQQQQNRRASPHKRRRIYYFAGGGWQMPASGEHWALLARLANRLPNTIISLISYPLAPRSPAPTAFPQLQTLYNTLLAQSHAANEYVLLGGDSAGGNIALCLVTCALASATPLSPTPTTAMTEEAPIAPSAIIVISPSTDLRRLNPDIKTISKHDPLLRIPFINSTARAWCGGNPTQATDPTTRIAPARAPSGEDEHPNNENSVAEGMNSNDDLYSGPQWDRGDPRVSPVLSDLKPLQRAGVKVHGITGGYDILAPDAVLFREKCREAGVEGQWLQWEKQMHCFPLAFTYKFPECVGAVEWLLEVLGREGTS